MIGFYRGMDVVYPAIALVVIIGWALTAKRSPFRIGAAAVASSVSFFRPHQLWHVAVDGIYPRTLFGLEACFVAAIPFFQNTLAGDLFYVISVFGFRIAELLVPRIGAGKAWKPRDRRFRCNFGALPVEAPLNLLPLVGNQWLTQGNIR